MTPRPMHRQDRQLPQEEAWALLTQGTYGVLSVVGDEGWPYAVPMHYTVMDGQIYLHCAKTGYKLDAIARDDRVCFTVTLREELVQDHATSLYESVVVLGRAALVTDQATGRILGAQMVCPWPIWWMPWAASPRTCGTSTSPGGGRTPPFWSSAPSTSLARPSGTSAPSSSGCEGRPFL